MIVCILPARNAAAMLPAWFESVARFADAVVALDDGSTDGTRDVLASSAFVATLLTNPARITYEGWDDSANRNRLLEAAGELKPTWIMQLDADELIPPDDAIALRRFVDEDASRSNAYLFRVLQMVGDLEHYKPSDVWYGRLFAYQPGQLFASERLHFVPIPTSIPRHRWTRTTLRIQHLASLNEGAQRLRYLTYQEADPHRLFQSSYEHLLEPATCVRRWRARPRRLPVVLPRWHWRRAAGAIESFLTRRERSGAVRSASTLRRDEIDAPPPQPPTC